MFVEVILQRQQYAISQYRFNLSFIRLFKGVTVVCNDFIMLQFGYKLVISTLSMTYKYVRHFFYKVIYKMTFPRWSLLTRLFGFQIVKQCKNFFFYNFLRILNNHIFRMTIVWFYIHVSQSHWAVSYIHSNVSISNA